ncbi:SspB family protein [Lutibaculum baratangense]|uniref:Stringent starvation protein B n=1 Tax=Lutibaculum baratangense AMV1 TaxID=631454 RepID=V4RPU9_9HYPH|nr:ClpXP protease specificity-enhancing factor SspB [Lutibaculum baratangense]ESR27304.1 protein of unknown function DUF1321 [Lutibaculum baratangense AMV1]
MAQDLIRYDLLAQDALRGVVRTVLADAARSGLPGEHHFFIAFETNAPGVRVSNRLREQYPEEMTVVLQHQYWDLEVTETGFTVSLSFNGVPEKLVVPFAAIKGFFDPSVQFGLQFEPVTQEQEEGEAEQQPTSGVAEFEAAEAGETVDADAPSPEGEESEADKSAEVVSLDAFRKKS